MSAKNNANDANDTAIREAVEAVGRVFNGMPHRDMTSALARYIYMQSTSLEHLAAMLGELALECGVNVAVKIGSL